MDSGVEQSSHTKLHRFLFITVQTFRIFVDISKKITRRARTNWIHYQVQRFHQIQVKQCPQRTDREVCSFSWSKSEHLS